MVVHISFIKGCPERHKKLFYGRFVGSGITFEERIDAPWLISTPYLYTSRESLEDFYLRAPGKVTVADMFAEAIAPDFNWFDYAIGTDRLLCGDRFVRYPLRLEYYADIQAYRDRETPADALLCKKHFCNFIYSNARAHRSRDEFFHFLSRYKTVHSLGRHLHNYDGDGMHCGDANGESWFTSSIKLKRPYKFSIAFENAYYSGYTSEKLPTSLMANTVPIYWGNPDVAQEYNPDAFINCHDYKDFGEVLEVVRHLDEHDDEYMRYLAASARTPEQLVAYNTQMENGRSMLASIFSQNPARAIRKGEGTWIGNYRSCVAAQTMRPSFHGFMRKLMRILAKAT